MKKLLIMLGVTIIFLNLGFCGCLDNNQDNNNDKSSDFNLFIGKWKNIIYYFDEYGERYDEPSSNTTFYNNGSMASESVENDELIWTSFNLENNQICLGEINDPDYLCYDYEFSNNGTKARLITYFTDPYSEYGETYMLVIELIKV